MKTVSDFVRPIRSRGASLVAYKAVADGVSKAVTLLVTVVAARVLPTESFGVLALAMTTGWILAVASDAGLPLYLARAVARADGGAGRIVGDVIRLRGGLAVAALGAGTVAAAIWAPPGVVAAFLLIVAAQILGGVLETVAHVYRGLGRSEIESSLTLACRLAMGVLAVAVLLTTPSLLWLGVALAMPQLLALIVSIGIARRITNRSVAERRPLLRSRRQLRDAGTGRILRDAAPIGMGVLLSALYFRCDVYFVEHWHGLDTVGMYNAAFRLVEALRLIPAAVLAVTFPALCRAVDPGPLRRLAGALTASGVVCAAIVYVTAPTAITVMYGAAYLPAAPALGMLAMAVPLFFLNYALTHQVIAWDGQRTYAAITGAALVANVCGNLALIPSQGMVGAATSTVLTEIVVTAGCLLALREKGARRLVPDAPAEKGGPFFAGTS